MGGLFSALTKTWSDGYQFGDILKTVGYDLNPLAWGFNKLNDKMFGTNNFEAEHGGADFISDGIVNSWNKMTGNAHLTPEYQHAEEREDTVNQRTANDMMLAGLSKYGFGGTSAGTSSAVNGLTLLDGIAKAQQIKANSIALKEQMYNFGVSRRLGIRTGDKNSLAQITSIAKALFGLDLSDLPEEGLIPYFTNVLKNAFGSGNGSTIGASADAGGSALSTGSKADVNADYSRSVSVAGSGIHETSISEPVVYMGFNSFKPVSEILSSTAEKGTTAWLRDNMIKDRGHIRSAVDRFFTSTGEFTDYGEKYVLSFAKRYKMSYDDASRLIYDWAFDYLR